MERLLTGLIDFSIKKVVSLRPICLEVSYNKDTQCPDVTGKIKLYQKW